MPYEPQKCTFSEPFENIGRQQIYACLTCSNHKRETLEKDNKTATPVTFQPNGVCYSCSIQCHADHDLAELFTKRNFACDCGTTRMPSNNPTDGSPSGCNLRRNHGSLDPPESVSNVYSHNFQGRFCSCDVKFVPDEQKGTMFQCLLGDDPCDEDWYHEECILGIPLGSAYNDDKKPDISNSDIKDENKVDESKHSAEPNARENSNNQNNNNEGDDTDDFDNVTLQGLPNVDQFDSFVCWKCVQKHREIFKQLADLEPSAITAVVPHGEWKSLEDRAAALRKRTFEDSSSDTDFQISKNVKPDIEEKEKDEENNKGKVNNEDTKQCSDALELSKHFPSKYECSLFMAPGFRFKLKNAVSNLKKQQEEKTSSAAVHTSLVTFLSSTYPFFISEELTYEPPEDDDDQSSVYEAGARALNDIPREQALNGLEAYAAIKQKLGDFFRPFAEQGKVVTEEDVTGFFHRMKEEQQERRGGI